MEDNESKSPWDDLVNELGAEPTEEAFERKQPPPTEIPPTSAAGSAERPDAPAASSSDWDALAGDLGVTADPPTPDAAGPIHEADDRASADDTSAAAEETVDENSPHDEFPPLPSEIDQAMSESLTFETAETDDGLDRDEVDSLSADVSEDDESDKPGTAVRDAFDSLFSEGADAWGPPPVKSEQLTSPVDFSDALEPFGEEAEKSSAEGDQEQDERPKRRRSRRRRGRGGRKREGEQAPADEGLRDEDTSSGEGREDGGEEVEDKEEERPRRRRSRRRSRRSSESADSNSDKARDANRDDANRDDANRDDANRDDANRDDANRDDADRDVADEGELDEISDRDEGSRKRGSRLTRTAHRNLPTWSEAIGVIVDSNLATRSKSTGKSNSSRGRGRGGRRRKKS